MQLRELEKHLKANPLAQRDAEVLKAALVAINQLETAGFKSGVYDLAPSFGGKTQTTPRGSLADLRSLCVR